VGRTLREAISPLRAASLQSDTDSEVLFALVLDHVADGATPADALAAVMHRVTAITTGRVNLLLTDGDAVYAPRWGNSLFARGSVVASEPLDDTTNWTEVPDRSLVIVDSDDTRITPL
jgi:glutamine amidotransferase